MAFKEGHSVDMKLTSKQGESVQGVLCVKELSFSKNAMGVNLVNLFTNF